MRCRSIGRDLHWMETAQRPSSSEHISGSRYSDARSSRIAYSGSTGKSQARRQTLFVRNKEIEADVKLTGTGRNLECLNERVGYWYEYPPFRDQRRGREQSSTGGGLLQRL